jgi:glycine/D-amino acid oxidase-like deaminating enzyme
MQRRRFLARLAAVAAGAVLPRRLVAGGRSRRVVVVGAGIIGAAIACRLARRGARVTLLDRSGPAAGATSRSFAWLNAEFSKQPLHYHQLHRLALASYRQLEQELPGLPVQWGGALQWFSDAKDAEAVRRQVRQQQEWGYPVRLVDADEFHGLEGELRPGRILAATFAEQEGFADPVATTQLLLARATAAGAEVVAPCEVTGLDIRRGYIAAVRTTHGDQPCEVLVVAAGVGTPAVAALAGIDVPLVPAPGLLVHTGPLPRLVHRVAVGPAAHLKQYADGRMVIGDDLGPPGTAAHDYLRQQPADFPDENFRELHRRRLLAEAAQYLPQLADAPVERVTVGWRPMPKDGYPIVGACRACPNLYLAVTHSGVTLAPLLGELASLEILDGVEVGMLAPYRPARFTAG